MKKELHKRELAGKKEAQQVSLELLMSTQNAPFGLRGYVDVTSFEHSSL